MNIPERSNSGLYLASSISTSLPAGGSTGAKNSLPSTVQPHRLRPRKNPRRRPLPTSRTAAPSSSPAGDPAPRPDPAPAAGGTQLTGQLNIHIFLLRSVPFPGATVQIYIGDQALVLRSFLADCTCRSPGDDHLVLSPPILTEKNWSRCVDRRYKVHLRQHTQHKLSTGRLAQAEFILFDEA